LADQCDDVRRQIALLARRKDARFISWSREMPCVWKPTTVMNPAVGFCFTDISAWAYIAELAECGHPIEEIELDQPAGEKGYVMTKQLEANLPDLYVKVQLKGGKIIGRSFHYSTK